MLVVIAAVWSLILIFTGFVNGLSALMAVRDPSNWPSVRLAALNLLEPTVTVSLICGAFYLSSGDGDFSNLAVSFLITSLIAGIPLSLMLLAPFFAPATLPFRNTIAMWGGLRWINTVLMWAAIPSVLLGSEFFQTVAVVLMISGLVILSLSLNKILAVLRELRTIEKV